LAHISEDKTMVEAFNEDMDIHTITASKIFGVDVENVSKQLRSRAKAVNFGIVYGISAYGLAEDLGITNSLASQFISAYYDAYPEIKEYMDKVIEECKENGYVKTLYNRVRYIPEINSKIYMQREFAKRMAMNAPIQGSAADIIKIAMINVDKALEDNGLKSRILVQVHDELVLEVTKGEEEIVQKIVRKSMEEACKLKVPLEVSDSFGDNWCEVK
jgi:DNA polymerase-1